LRTGSARAVPARAGSGIVQAAGREATAPSRRIGTRVSRRRWGCDRFFWGRAVRDSSCPGRGSGSAICGRAGGRRWPAGWPARDPAGRQSLRAPPASRSGGRRCNWAAPRVESAINGLRGASSSSAKAFTSAAARRRPAVQRRSVEANMCSRS